MRIKYGPIEGNSGAVIRWGECLDNGIWFRGWKYRKLWKKWKYIKGRYLSLGIVVFQWSN